MLVDRVHLPDFSRLTWRDVDPAGRPGFDPAGVAALVRSLPPATEVPPAGTDWRLADFWWDRMTEALVERLGPWAAGWQHTVVVEDYPGRGVIPVWWEVRLPITTPDETLDGLAAALVAWHELTVEIATDARGRFTASAPGATVSGGDPAAWQAVKAPGVSRFQPGHFTRRIPHPSILDWADVDPRTREFDPATVTAVVAGLVTPENLPAQGADWRLQDLWLENVSIGLTERYGSWAAGWRWSVGEGDLDGGPVTAWCCLPHSVTSPEETAATVGAALIEWHEWLAETAERFDRFLPLAPGDLDGWERAVAHLVTAVGDRTQYESAWYGCCLTVLGWFLDAAGIARGEQQRMLDHAIGGRFASWVEPDPTLVASVAERLAGQATRA
ncbi:hypothetical protein AMIS_30750 [Actinoplanes missouriensis 431]|uniref:Uncharacterized protein n=1 Tax=Actinoplanes missouriensis (strain ATCC 14538 / DSM 43046 / CBS 188.64 / JCM 3121 / NBRC 102363 / NCIMB 12654 / NRRL B-3342 / UNCC 431) TaxID=512565 RepID=I0H5K8_ACTM4|nr:hypothetical protein [Actinoplanes missouriensis]BAL88295.1 hypothetical protein AMIS_30750 [Actinoplanes missouriensis 431]